MTDSSLTGLFIPEDFDARVKDLFLQTPEDIVLSALDELGTMGKSRIKNVSAHLMHVIHSQKNPYPYPGPGPGPGPGHPAAAVGGGGAMRCVDTAGNKYCFPVDVCTFVF